MFTQKEYAGLKARDLAELKVCRLETEDQLVFPSASEDRDQCSISAFLLYSDFLLIGGVPPLTGRALGFTGKWSTDSSVHLRKKHSHRHTQNNI